MNTKKPSITGTSPTEIFQSRLVMLTISFPRLRILWSSSPRQTAEMFADLKYQREEPDRDKAVSIGQDEVGQQDLIEENWSTVPSEVLRCMPGVTGKNYHYISNKVKSIRHLVELTNKELRDIMGVDQGNALFNFVNKIVNK